MMKHLIQTIILISISSNITYAQNIDFNPVTKTGTLGSLNPGAILTKYVNPPVQNTYNFIDQKDINFKKEKPQDIINVEKIEAFGKIITNP